LSNKNKNNKVVAGKTVSPFRGKLMGKKYEIFFWSVFVLAILASFVFRVTLPAQDLIDGNNINFPDVDSYYHLWQADYTYTNWPKVETHTQMLYFPEGQGVGQRPLNSWLIATLAKILGLTVEIVGVYFPAILGVLVLIPVLLIGWIIWNKWAGLIAVASLAVIQGEFYGRLSLGVSDQHALEVFLTCWLILFIVLAFKKNWLWSIAAGITLGLYYLAWAGAPIFTIILLIMVVIQSIINQYKEVSNKNLTLSVFMTLLIAWGMFSLVRSLEVKYMLVYGLSVSVPLILQVLSKYIKKSILFVSSIVASAVLGFTGLYLYNADLVKLTLVELQGLTGTIGAKSGDLGSTISEVQPLLSPYGDFTFDLALGCFGLIFFIGLIGLVFAFRTKGKPEWLIVLIWTLIILLITIFQRRYGYYLAVNLCLMSGFIWWLILSKLGWKEYSKKKRKEGFKGKYFSEGIAILGAILISISMIIPNAVITSKVVHQHPYAMTMAWREGLNFLRDSTIKPVNYGVISWWDYGYWIMREGQRPVPCHPGGGNTDKVSKFFTAYTSGEANDIAVSMKCKYVVIDYQMALQKFYAIPILAGKGKLTEQQMNDTLLYRLYYSESGIAGYKEVFESSTKYDGQSQVKIYEIYDYQEACNCGK
jgi:dolichyl-diphosphooligosaccharide--protein glycosyltransferase